MLYGIVMENAQFLVEPTIGLISAAGLTAIVIRCETDISREPAIVLAFGEQVMQIHQQTTLIPMRYGSILKNDDEVKELLHKHQFHYQALLVEFNNCEEMGIRLSFELMTDNTMPLQQPVTGHHYLLARKRAYTIPEYIEQQAEILTDNLTGLYRQRCAAMSVFNGQQTYLLSYLVPRNKLTAFRERLLDSMNIIGDTCAISGPWPPYNFASE
jgi:hypothetical protein